MEKLTIELCPESGICSIVRKDGTKVDLMPDEVTNLRKALNNPESARTVIAEIDETFAKSLKPGELAQLSDHLKQ
ncbi:MAG: hypothetical protein WCN95_04630 [bacterium]